MNNHKVLQNSEIINILNKILIDLTKKFNVNFETIVATLKKSL